MTELYTQAKDGWLTWGNIYGAIMGELHEHFFGGFFAHRVVMMVVVDERGTPSIREKLLLVGVYSVLTGQGSSVDVVIVVREPKRPSAQSRGIEVMTCCGRGIHPRCGWKKNENENPILSTCFFFI